MAGGKRTREDNSGLSLPQGNDGSKRVTRSTSQAQHAEAGGPEITQTQRLDTAASPARPGYTRQAPLLLPPRPLQNRDTINKLSTIASKHLDAQAHARLLHEIQVDDQLAEVAYQRGLLATFIVTPPSSASGSSPPFQVEAPEFATVEYLKRRITKEKLLISNELYVYDRFALRQAPIPDRSSREEQAPPREMKLLDGKMPSTTIPMLLFNLGYRGGETYHVSMISRAGTTDKVQQENMIREAATEGKQRIVPLADAAAREYQELLNGGPLEQPQRPIPRAVPIAKAKTPIPIADKILLPIDPAAGMLVSAAAPAPLPSPEVAAAAAAPGAATGSNNNMLQFNRSPRQGRAGRWSVQEVAALLGGVQVYGYNWAEIKRACTERASVIDPRRTAVDYKDKWRNLVLTCKDPNKAIRSVGISEEMKDLILSLEQT